MSVGTVVIFNWIRQTALAPVGGLLSVHSLAKLLFGVPSYFSAQSVEATRLCRIQIEEQ